MSSANERETAMLEEQYKKEKNESLGSYHESSSRCERPVLSDAASGCTLAP